jgi:hypothetical protein
MNNLEQKLESLRAGVGDMRHGSPVTVVTAPADAVPDDAGRRLLAGEPMTVAEMQHALGVARQEIVRLVSEVAMLTAERDTASEEVERHRMTREERGAASYFSFFHGSPREDDARSATILLGYLDRTNEVE